MKNQMIIMTSNNGTAYLPVIEGGAETIIDLYKNQAQKLGVQLEFEVFNSGKMPLEKLPAVVKTQVLNTLKVYDTCNVYFEYGEFHTHASVGIKSSYGIDHYVCGNYLAKDVYTEEQRRKNYTESLDNFIDAMFSI